MLKAAGNSSILLSSIVMETAMAVKASISLTDAQDAYARALVAQGRYSSLSSVLQQGLDLLRQDIERKDTEIEALRTLIDERRAGSFIALEDGFAQTDARIKERRAVRGL